MNIRTDIPLTKDAFLRWNETQEGRYEFVEGKIMMMTGASWGHVEIAGNLQTLLRSGLDRSRFAVGQSDFAVETARGLRYPDVFVQATGVDRHAYVSTAPILLAEILSPSSLETDLRQKVEEYTALPSLSAYVVLAQDEPRLWLWQRGEDGAFPHAPEMIEGADATLPLPALGVSLPLAAIYEGVG
ncbi:Uma2 family endonuclease [Ancylobacter oerskovii]|uniref:Uma2 family endonuclease n=1 Tax=Ancylobacter oerskovii TaxID=459519 RepID=A0ABW4Z269_9HYPH|nr:Uma2 family endonuclease [Ancylobacter oerskovii]MBS7544801.1 Uma2 family endonuclease [Ancylobacter oerskovii]